MRSVVGPAGGLNANVPEDLLLVRHNLKENRIEPISTLIIGGHFDVVWKLVEVDRTSINGATHVGKRSKLFKRLSRLEKAAAADGDLDELGVEFGGQEASDHVGDLGDEVGLEGVAGG